jgi:hypothetical protein
MKEYFQREREREVTSWIRQGAGIPEVSGDLRHRVLDQAHWVQREQHATSKLWLVCLAISAVIQLMYSLVPGSGRVRQVSMESASWADSLSTLPSAEMELSRYVLTWSGPIPSEVRGVEQVGEGERTTPAWYLLRARTDPEIFSRSGHSS